MAHVPELSADGKDIQNCRVTDREYEDDGFAEHGASDKTDHKASDTDQRRIEVVPPSDFTGECSSWESLASRNQTACIHCTRCVTLQPSYVHYNTSTSTYLCVGQM